LKNETGKAPTIQWYYKDWLSDKKLQLASPTTRGIWMNLLMYMIDCSLDGDECEGGELTNLTTRQIMQLGGCIESEAEAFIEDACAYAFCDIFVTSHGDVTIKSRRLKREHISRISARDRKRKQRRNEQGEFEGRKDVTPQTHRAPTPTPSPSTNYNAHFIQFWEAYPNKVDKKRSYKIWNKIPSIETLLPTILSAVKNQTIFREQKKSRKEFVPEWKHPSTWLNGECWEDEINIQPEQELVDL